MGNRTARQNIDTLTIIASKLSISHKLCIIADRTDQPKPRSSLPDMAFGQLSLVLVIVVFLLHVPCSPGSVQSMRFSGAAAVGGRADC